MPWDLLALLHLFPQEILLSGAGSRSGAVPLTLERELQLLLLLAEKGGIQGHGAEALLAPRLGGLCVC